MGKTEAITSWLMGCPELSALWNISAEMADGANVLLPAGTSERRNISDQVDVTGCYEADLIPTPSVYEEFQVNCYKTFVDHNNDYNVMNFEDVEKAIAWVQEQDETLSFPGIEGKKIVSVEANPFQPQIRGIDPDSKLVCYYFTLRIRYVNTAKGRSVEWQM